METTSIPNITLPDEVGPASKVWIYQANRNFTEEELSRLHPICADFVKSWQAHGTNLLAAYAIYFDRFLCLFADESRQGATGCSIDSSVRLVQDIEKKFQISLLDRRGVAYLENENLRTTDFSELSTLYSSGMINNGTPVFNNLVATKSEMETGWIIPLSESWHHRMVS